MSYKNKLKILHVISQRPDSTGSGIYVQAMIRESATTGYDNFLVAGVCSGGCTDIEHIQKDRSIFVDFYSSGLSYRIPGMSDVMPYESSRFCDLSEEDIDEYEVCFSKSLKKAVEIFKPDIIHSHHLWIVSSITRQLFPDIPVVTSCHGSDLRQFQNCEHLQERVLKGCRTIDIIIALSQAQKNDINKLYNIPPERIVIAGAGYNDRVFYPEEKPSPNPVNIIYAGKLSNAKGVPWLLKALQSMESSPWHLHLIGSGTGKEMEHCLKLAEELGEKVTVYGSLPQPGLARIMRSCHILVLPSFFEGLPLVILEGLASGCRIVATKLPGADELLGGSSADYISLVTPPRLRFTDQPYREDEPEFVKNLQKSINYQIKASSNSESIDLSTIQETLDSYTWNGVFKKVKKAYLKAMHA